MRYILICLLLAFPAAAQECVTREQIDRAASQNGASLVRVFGLEESRRIATTSLAERDNSPLQVIPNEIVVYEIRGHGFLLVGFVDGCRQGGVIFTAQGYQDMLRRAKIVL